MAIYVLMANGDIHTLCPVLPLRSSTQLSQLIRLKAYLAVEGSKEEQQWLEGLAKQIPPPSSGDAPQTPPKSILSRSVARKAQAEAEVPDRVVRLHPPHLTEGGGPAPGQHMVVKKVGPVMMDPAAEEGEAFIDLTPAQRALQAELREYFSTLISADEAADIATTRHGKTYEEIIKRMGRDGWLGVGWPTEYGGKGFGHIEQQIFTNEATRADVPLPSVTASKSLPDAT